MFKHCDRLRRGKRIPTRPLIAGDDVVAVDSDPAQAAEKRELADHVLAAISALPDDQRTATTLFYINGYSQNEVAEFLEVPVSTIKNRLHAARRRLKQRMLNMVADELKSHVLGEDLPKRICELLAMPRPLEIPGHPVRQVWEALRACFADAELVELDEILPRAASHLPSQSIGRVAYEIDETRMLRTDLSDGLRQTWLSQGGGACQLIAVGRTFRKGAAAVRTGGDCFHQAELLWCDRGLNEEAAMDAAQRATRTVLGDQPVRIGKPVPMGGGVMARELEGGWQDGWLEFGVAGLHPAQLVEQAGVDPSELGAVCIGFGLERCAMIRDQIDDIRKLWRAPYVPGGGG